MSRIEVKSGYRRQRVTIARRRLRPSVLALEGRTLLSTIVVNNPTDIPVTGQTEFAGNRPGEFRRRWRHDRFLQPVQQPADDHPDRRPARAERNHGRHHDHGPGANLLTVNGNGSRVFDIAGGSAAISGLTVSDGYLSAGYGAGVCNNQGTLSLTDVTISGNEAVGGNSGGGLANLGGTTTLTDCTVSGNVVGRGDDGGGLFNDGGTTTLTDCTVSGNNASDGGGLFNQSYGTLALTNCTVSNNDSNVNGGGLVNNGTTRLTDVTISGNSANDNGGGLINNGSTTTLTNCTVSGNSAKYNGGGLLNYGTTALTNCTVSNNYVFTRGGGLLNYGTTTLTNCIVAGNQGRKGTNVSGGYSNGGGNLVGGNALLAPLGDYGGPTQTMALLPGSPAIGGGTPVPGVTTDQRGQPRTGPIDIGTFQSRGFTIAPVAGSTPQTALVNAAFASPLAVAVMANNPVEPVDGGVVEFALTPAADGASARRSRPPGWSLPTARPV